MNQSVENKNIPKLAKEVFNLVDTDGSNTISLDELQTLINQMAASLDIESPPHREIQKLLEEFDDNGDGQLQLEEFQKLVQQLFAPADDSPVESSKRDSFDQNNSDDEDDSIIPVPMKQHKKQSFRYFIHTVQKKKLSALDGSLIQMLIQQQKRQSRLSCTLDQEVGKLVKEIDNMTFSKKSSTVKDSMQNSSQISNEERQQIDKRYMNNSHIIRTGSITSVFTSMEPKSIKKSVQLPKETLGLEIPQQKPQMSSSYDPKTIHIKNSKSLQFK